MRADCSWSECPDSTDSQKRASASEVAFETVTAGPSRALPQSGSARVPCPRTAAKSAPRPPRPSSQVGAAEDAHHHLAALEQPQRHRVLLAAQEALGAVDGVEGPVAAVARVGAAAVDPREHGVGVGTALHLAGDLAHHRLEQARLGALSQLRGALLAHHGVAGKRLQQPLAHDRLRGEVGDGDGALVLLLEGLGGREPLLHRATDPRGGTHGLHAGRELCFERQGLSPPGWGRAIRPPGTRTPGAADGAPETPRDARPGQPGPGGRAVGPARR